jgi:hypothetical protein
MTLNTTNHEQHEHRFAVTKSELFNFRKAKRNNLNSFVFFRAFRG